LIRWIFANLCLYLTEFCWLQNEEAANSARNMLEYVESVTTVPQKLVGWIVGQGGANIREIEQKAELLSLNVGTACHSSVAIFFSLLLIPFFFLLQQSLTSLATAASSPTARRRRRAWHTLSPSVARMPSSALSCCCSST
jgi:hypothetical protein